MSIAVAGNPGKLDGKVALITGGGTGIGRAAALLFAQEGAKVVVVGQRAQRIEEVAAEVIEAGGQCSAVVADVSVAGDCERMVHHTDELYGGLDVLFNNAGIGHDSDVVELSESEWDRVVDVNLKGVFLGCKYATPIMRRRGGGSIVNTASTAGMVGSARRVAYCASKGGVIALTRALAVEFLSYNIRVNAVCPGATHTPMAEQYYHKDTDPEGWIRHQQRQPLGRLSAPEDIARGVLFLASGDSPTTTGICLVIDGGWTTL